MLASGTDAARIDCLPYLIAPDGLVTAAAIPIHFCRDGFGNCYNRIIAPGKFDHRPRGLIEGKGEPDAVFADARQHAMENLPDNACFSGGGVDHGSKGHFTIVRLLPIESNMPQYRIRNNADRQERTVPEDEIGAH